MLAAVSFLAAMTASSFVAAQDLQRWERLLDEAARAFEAKDYEAALEHYSEAQQILDAPKLRLQVAVVHERLGQCAAARALYESLLREIDIDEPTQELAQQRLDELASCKPAAAAGDPTIQVEVVPSDPAVPHGRHRKRNGAILLGSGGAAIVGGTLLALHLFVPEHVEDCAGLDGPIDCTGYAARGRETQEPLQLRDGARRTMLLHRVVGISVAGVGALVSVLGIRLLVSRPTGATATLSVTPHGVQAVLTW